MRLIKILAALLIVGVIVSACGKDDVSGNGESFKGLVGTEKNALDEREVIKKAYLKQKEIKKVSFLNETNSLRSANFIYEAEKGTLTLSQDIYLTGDYDSLNFQVYVNSESDQFEYNYENMKDKTEVSVNGMDVVYGNIEENSVFFGKENNVQYGLTSYSDIIDKEGISLVGKSLETEKEGSWDLFYESWGIEFDAIQFPYINRDEVSVSNVFANYYQPSGSKINIRYTTTEGKSFDYMITDYLPESQDLEVIDTDKLDNGNELTIWGNKENQDDSERLYTWENGEYYYGLSHYIDLSPSNQKEIIKIINSSLQDNRSFVDLGFTKNIQKVDRSLNEESQLVIQKIKGGNAD